MFDNRYEITWQEPKSEWTEAEFFELRDKVFAERMGRIASVREDDFDFYARNVDR